MVLVFFIIMVSGMLGWLVYRRRRYFFPKTRGQWDILLLLLALLLLGGAYWSSRGNVKQQAQGTPTLMFALDVSRSMLCDDGGISRLQHAREIVEDLRNSFPDCQAGLVSFAGSAMLDFPPSLDAVGFHDALRLLDVSLEDVPGSDAGAALKLAEEISLLNSCSPLLLVLLSDGELQCPRDSYGQAFWQERTKPLVWLCVGEGGPQPIPLGQVWMRDPETGETALSQASPKEVSQLASLSEVLWIKSSVQDGPEKIAGCMRQLLGKMEVQEGGGKTSMPAGVLALLGAVCILGALGLRPQLQLAVVSCLLGAMSLQAEETVENIKQQLSQPGVTTAQRAALLANWAVLLADGNLEDAVKLTQEALRLNPASAVTADNLKILIRRQKQLQDECVEKTANDQKSEERTQRKEGKGELKAAEGLEDVLGLPEDSRQLQMQREAQGKEAKKEVPGTWRELQHRNRNLKGRPKGVKPW